MIGFLKEIVDFYIQKKKIWAIPIVIVMIILGALLLFSGGGSAFAPFIYAVF